MKISLTIVLATVVILLSTIIVEVLKAAKKAKPVTPKASPEATALLKYFYSISGKHILSRQHNFPYSEKGTLNSLQTLSEKHL